MLPHLARKKFFFKGASFGKGWRAGGRVENHITLPRAKEKTAGKLLFRNQQSYIRVEGST